MSSIALILKNNLKNISPGLGFILNKLPFEYRPGLSRTYRLRKHEIYEIDTINKKDFIFERMKKIVNYSYSNVKFYKDFYDEQGFSPTMLNDFDDIVKIPITNKSILNNYNLEDRSSQIRDRYLVNTGGSSGTPFCFYIQPDSIGHEWAHMHHIWKKLNYDYKDVKLVFGGRSNVKDLIDYDVVRNSFSIDLYSDYDVISNKLEFILTCHKIKFLHGYPSSIYEFALYCENSNPKLLQLLKKNLVGVFLGSEYPHLYYRETIEKVFDVRTISWYGHTERAVLAYERDRNFEYYPFLTYGYSEAIKNLEDEYDLVSTSYYNFASPLIRYNTNDLINEPKFEDGILCSFQILNGRNGEFVTDINNNKINLTALIFGRHHELFNYIKFIQVKQLSAGLLQIFFVSDMLDEESASNLFDKRNLNFKLIFKKINEPIRTVSGKINLLIK